MLLGTQELQIKELRKGLLLVLWPFQACVTLGERISLSLSQSFLFVETDSHDGNGLREIFQKDCEDGTNPGIGKYPINSKFQFYIPYASTLSFFQRLTQFPGPKWKTVRRQEFRTLRTLQRLSQSFKQPGDCPEATEPHSMLETVSLLPSSHWESNNTFRS